MKSAVALVSLLVLAGCATAPTVGPLDVDPNVPFLSAAPTAAAPSPSAEASPSASASPTASPSTSASPSASPDCTNDADACIKDGDTCPTDKVGKSGTGADDKKFTCAVDGDGDENVWKAA